MQNGRNNKKGSGDQVKINSSFQKIKFSNNKSKFLSANEKVVLKCNFVRKA